MEATIGGTKRHLIDLAMGLRAAGWEVEVACPRVRDAAIDDVSFWDDLARAGVPLHEVPMRRSPLTRENGSAIFRLAALIRRGRYQIVHAHSSVAGAVARPAVLLASAPVLGTPRPRVVYTPHGYAFLMPGSAPRRRVFLGIERALGQITDRIIALSPTEAQETRQHGIVPDARIALIPNGVTPPDPQREADARRQQGWGTVPVVGTVARMTLQKDPDTWLRMAARIATARPDVRFAWVWGGEMEAHVRREAQRLGLAEKLDFLGYRADARHLIGAYDVFVLSSVFEGLPYTVLEALASGTPVVATDVVGTRDVLRHGETGLLASAGDDEALAGHVLRLLEAPTLRRRLAEAGRADVLQRYSVQNMVDRTAALYADLTP